MEEGTTEYEQKILGKGYLQPNDVDNCLADSSQMWITAP